MKYVLLSYLVSSFVSGALIVVALSLVLMPPPKQRSLFLRAIGGGFAMTLLNACFYTVFVSFVSNNTYAITPFFGQ